MVKATFIYYGSDGLNKGIKFSLYVLAIGIGFIIIGFGLSYILQTCGLMPRAWVGFAFFIVMALLGFLLLGGIVYTFIKALLKPPAQTKKGAAQRILSIFGIVVTILVTGVFGIFVLLEYNEYAPDHAGEKYGLKMVAFSSENHVDYHEYRNCFVCDKKAIGEEWYMHSSHRFDPFGSDNSIPVEYYFYDFQGNLIERYEAEVTPVDIPEKIDVSFPPEEMKCIFDSTGIDTGNMLSFSADGENWDHRYTDYQYKFFFDNIGYLVFSYDWAMQHEAAVIYKSVDGGKNWKFVSNTPSDELLQNTAFFDENTWIFEYGIAGTDSYALYATVDGAGTFRKVELPVEMQGRADETVCRYVKTFGLDMEINAFL